MKRTHVAALLTIAISIGFFGGWTTFRHTPSKHDDVWLSLGDEVKAFLESAKDNLAKGVDCRVKVGHTEVSASRITNSNQSGKSLDQEQYFLFLPDWPKPKFPGLSGLLTLRKTDAKHVDIIFRPGVLRLGLMDIGICVDDYDLGVIAWGSGAERNVSNNHPTVSNSDSVNGSMPLRGSSTEMGSGPARINK